jgi:hypothetical protein
MSGGVFTSGNSYEGIEAQKCDALYDWLRDHPDFDAEGRKAPPTWNNGPLAPLGAFRHVVRRVLAKVQSCARRVMALIAPPQETPMTLVPKNLLCVMVVLPCLATVPAAAAGNPLRVVGVLGNTSGMSDRPVPYAFYCGIAVDGHGRLLLSGAAQGVVVCDQDGRCLAVLPLADLPGYVPRSLLVRAGQSVFGVALAPGGTHSAVFRIDAAPADATQLRAARIAAGPGHWALSATLDPKGRIVLGQSQPASLRYSVLALEPDGGRPVPLFELDQPKGSLTPWRHLVRVDPDGAVSIQHSGGVNWSGRFAADGRRLGDAVDGHLLDGFRYHFGYEGGLRRMDLTDQRAAPGECGSEAPEIRMAGQIVRSGQRYFLAGRGGAVEASWNGTHFAYTRRVGAIYLEDLAIDGPSLRGLAYTAAGNDDVQHGIELPKDQPIGQMLRVGTPLHGVRAEACVPAPDGLIAIYRNAKGVGMRFEGSPPRQFDEPLPEVRSIGQAALLGNDLLLADPQAGTIWRRPLMAHGVRASAWRSDVPGVVGLAAAPGAVYAATPTKLFRLASDGTEVWTAAEPYRGIRRLAATPEAVYVCDTAAHVVDQLDATTGRRQARLGVPGEPGPALDRLDHPYAVAADADAVYVADNGNGRVLVATTTLWRPEIVRLPRDEGAPVVAATIPISVPQPGRLSLNVYDENDVTVRQVACALPIPGPVQGEDPSVRAAPQGTAKTGPSPSSVTVTWDGRDLYGQWVPPGRYRYHALLAPKLSLRYVTSIGQSGHPPYRTADGTGSWGGVWGYVMDVCTVSEQPDADIVALWAVEEGEGGLVRMSRDGTVRWKQHLEWWMKAQQMAVASDGQSIYIAAASALGAPAGQFEYSGELNRPLLWRVDAKTGDKRPFPDTDPQRQCMFGRYLPGPRIVTDLAVLGGKVYLTAPAQDMLFVADARTGRQLAAWPVPQVSGVTAGAGGRLLVGSGRRIVVLDAVGRPERTLADAGGPIWALKTAPGGQLVASVGPPRQQVVYFDAAGRELRAVGRPGGRPKCGRMIAEAFRDPVGLCVAGDGTLFVAESAAPKRFTRWSPEGRLEREFHGPYYYSGMFGIDEEQPEHVYGDTHADLIRYVVDYATGRWNVDHYWIDAYKDAGMPVEKDSNAPVKWWPRIRHHDGRTWWASGSGGILELRDDRVRGVAAVYGGAVERLPDGNYRPSFGRKPGGLMGTWSDTNGDGRVQPDEWHVTDRSAYPVKAAGPQQGWGAYFDENFDLYMHDWSDDAAGGVWQIPVARWTPYAPVYLWENARHVGLPLGHGLAHGASGARTAFYHDGAVYAFNGGYNAAQLPGVGHGHDWEFAQITCYDARSGRPKWHAGERAAAFIAPGQHYCPTGPAGVVDDYLFWTDENSLVHVWDVRHGLYVDTLLEDCSRGPVPSPYTVWVELFNSRVLRHPRTGKVYLLAASDAIHVFEVLGLGQPPARFQGEFLVTQAGLDAARRELASRTARRERTLLVRRARGPVTIDGNLDEFAAAPAAEMVLHEHARGTARLMYDDRFLYLACDVQDDSPWKNVGSDVSTLFKTGDTIDLWLGPSAGRRPLVPGDVRVLLAPQGGRTVAVAYRPKVLTDRKPVPFRSPAGEVWMDRVEVLGQVQAAVKIVPGGYRLEAAIPRAAVGLEGSVERFGLDISINFSDPAGQRNVARIHWGRHGAATVYDLPSETRLEPETWGIGVLER